MRQEAAPRFGTVQIELTTRCNFSCFYCAGRAMKQEDMPLERFSALLDAHVARFGVPKMVSLQGEGEPTMHPAFFEMAAHVARLGATPFTITNGTYKHPERFLEHFRVVGVSIDSVDPKVASRVGRHNLPRVLAFTEWLAARLTVRVFTVALAPAQVQGVAAWCRARDLPHEVQSLNPKDDYQVNYRIAPAHRSAPPRRFRCRYLERDLMRYYDLDGREMPCCFIKDASAYPGIDAMQAALGGEAVPTCCTGCRYLEA